MQLDKAIETRRSVKNFTSKKPDWRNIVEAINSARYAPIAGGNFTSKFIIIDNPKHIQELTKSCQQDFVGQAQYVVVVCSDPTRTVNLFGKDGKNYVKQQVGSAIQNFLLKINDQNLGACWVGYFDENSIKRILKIPGKIDVEAIIPIGYAEKSQPIRRTKIDIDNVLYFDKYGQKKMKE